MIKADITKGPSGTPDKVLSALPDEASSAAAPKLARAVSAAIHRLSDLAPGHVEQEFNQTGFVRYLTADGDGLFYIPYAGTPLAYARSFLTQPDTIAALGLSKAALVDGKVDKFPFGTRVQFAQVLKLADHAEPLPVRGGFVHVLVDNAGRLIQVESSVRQGRVPQKIGKIISQDEAVALALKAHGTEDSQVRGVRLVMSSHECTQHKKSTRRPALKMDPTYEVVVHSAGVAPTLVEKVIDGELTYEVTDKGIRPSVKEYLIDGRTGKVICVGEKLRFSQVSRDQKVAQEPACRYFPKTPDPKIQISQQLIDYTIAQLPDPTRLENSRLTMLVQKNGRWDVAKAKPDGTFNYSTNDPEFDAVHAFVAINEQLNEFEKWGMPAGKLSNIHIYSRDRSVVDNAYFDPGASPYEAHIGVGSGPPNGLRKNIGWDIMVIIHEVDGHGLITVLTPGNDLPGPEGSDMHEGLADWAAIVREYYNRAKFAKQIGASFGVADVQADGRVIGPYTIDGGIRTQRNTKKTPQDKTGEPHSDGEIVGAAAADLLEALIVKENDVIKGCEAASRLHIAALALVPAHKVEYRDFLRALITADQTLNQSAHRALIEKAFSDHGIKLASQAPRKRKNPKQGPGKRKNPKKGPSKPKSPKKGPSKRKSPTKKAA
jgi:hypothetical protein